MPFSFLSRDDPYPFVFVDLGSALGVAEFCAVRVARFWFRALSAVVGAEEAMCPAVVPVHGLFFTAAWDSVLFVIA